MANSELSLDMMEPWRVSNEAVRMMPYTYKRMYPVSLPSW